MNRTLLTLVCAIALTLAGCKSSQEMKSEDENGKTGTETEKPALPAPGVSPGHCRIVGTVVSIDPTLSAIADDPCGKAPCLAVVRINEIVGYGSAFPTVLGKDQEIKVRFRHTLGESLQPKLPGLNIGSTFQADLTASGPVMQGENRSANYVIESYVVRETK